MKDGAHAHHCECGSSRGCAVATLSRIKVGCSSVRQGDGLHRHTKDQHFPLMWLVPLDANLKVLLAKTIHILDRPSNQFDNKAAEPVSKLCSLGHVHRYMHNLMWGIIKAKP